MDNNGDISRSQLAFVVAALTRNPVTDLAAAKDLPATGDLAWVGVAPGPAAADTPGPTDAAWARCVARAAVDRILHQHAENNGADPEPGLVFGRLDLDRFVDDLVAAPARWPVPSPIPGGRPWWPQICRWDGSLDGRDLLAAGAEIQLVANPLDAAHPLRQPFAGAADRLLEVGLDRTWLQAMDHDLLDRIPEHKWVHPLVSFAKHR